ncbi:MAG: PadR family transcriptional regulator [Methanobacterium sp. ERen5]|nr:MAG: PadR family transcriptional regulator [Methanobacterium sp. ERen5]
MVNKGSNSLQDSKSADHANTLDNDPDCKSKLSKELREYDIKLLKSMKGFGKTMILWIISKERIHGYEIMSKLNTINPAEKKMHGKPGKIYPMLHDLEKAGLVTGTWEAHGKRKMKYYEITEEGIQTLERIKRVFRCHRTALLEEFWRDMLTKND